MGISSSVLVYEHFLICIQMMTMFCLVMHKFYSYMWAVHNFSKQKYFKVDRAHSHINEPPRDKTNKLTCAPNDDSDQPGQSLHCALSG